MSHIRVINKSITLDKLLLLNSLKKTAFGAVFFCCKKIKVLKGYNHYLSNYYIR